VTRISYLFISKSTFDLPDQQNSIYQEFQCQKPTYDNVTNLTLKYYIVIIYKIKEKMSWKKFHQNFKDYFEDIYHNLPYLATHDLIG